MKIQQALGILFFLGLFTQAPQAKAQSARCNGLDVQLNPGNYNLVTNNFPTLSLQVSRNNNNNGCQFFIVMDYGAASSASSRQLTNGAYSYPVQIYKDSGKSQILKKIDDANSSSDILSGEFPDESGSTTQSFSYYVFLDNSLYNRFGNYSQSFNVSLYSGTLASKRLEQTRVLTLNYTQSRKIDLSLVDTGAAFDKADTSQTLNFGNLTTGDSRSFDLILEYNAGFRLTVTSANNGTLKHANLNDRIDYTMNIFGNNLNLSSGSVTSPSISGMSPAGGQRLPVQVTIGSVSGKNSGIYSDTVTFSVVSVE